jgi:hypothetical protein
MDFTFLQFHVFPEFALHFCSPDYENLPGFRFCNSILRMSYSRQQPSFPISSCKWFTAYHKLADAQLQVICMHQHTIQATDGCSKTNIYICVYKKMFKNILKH